MVHCRAMPIHGFAKGTLAGLICITAALGCGGKDDGAKDTKETASDAKDKKPSTSAKASGSPHGGASNAPTTATGSAAPSPDASPTVSNAAPSKPVTLPGRSPLPMAAEWEGVKEVGVKGSGALGCETKLVREWLRISCRGKNDTGGTPTTIQLVRGTKSEAFIFTGGNVTSLVLPYVEGADWEYVFSWTDKSHKLVLKWPKGAPKPPLLGTFEGAASPLDAKPAGTPTCGDIYNADCERTYKGNCQSLIECARGEPSTTPACLSTHRLGPMNTCWKKCSNNADCAAGERCLDDWGPPAVCRED